MRCRGLQEHIQTVPKLTGGNPSNPNFLGCMNTVLSINPSFYVPIILAHLSFSIQLLVYILCYSVFKLTHFPLCSFLLTCSQSPISEMGNCIVHSVLSAELPDVFWWVKDELLFPKLYSDGFMPLHRNETPFQLSLFFHPNLNSIYFYLYCLMESNFLLKTWGILVYTPCSIHAREEKLSRCSSFQNPKVYWKVSLLVQVSAFFHRLWRTSLCIVRFFLALS